MKKVEGTGRTVEEAMEAAARELGVGIDAIEYEVLEEANRGFLGLVGGRMARVSGWIRMGPVERAEDFLQGLLERMGVQAEMQRRDVGDYVHFSLQGKHVGVLIGRRGRTLDSLQYLVNLVANKGSQDMVRLIVDVGGYRERRAETLERLGKRLAERVRRQRRKVVLEPMTPQERRVIHLALQEENGVNSHSEGDEPFRKVVISPEI